MASSITVLKAAMSGWGNADII